MHTVDHQIDDTNCIEHQLLWSSYRIVLYCIVGQIRMDGLIVFSIVEAGTVGTEG